MDEDFSQTALIYRDGAHKLAQGKSQMWSASRMAAWRKRQQ